VADTPSLLLNGTTLKLLGKNKNVFRRNGIPWSKTQGRQCGGQLSKKQLTLSRQHFMRQHASRLHFRMKSNQLESTWLQHRIYGTADLLF
jgi:hypothetical protein